LLYTWLLPFDDVVGFSKKKLRYLGTKSNTSGLLELTTKTCSTRKKKKIFFSNREFASPQII